MDANHGKAALNQASAEPAPDKVKKRDPEAEKQHKNAIRQAMAEMLECSIPAEFDYISARRHSRPTNDVAKMNFNEPRY